MNKEESGTYLAVSALNIIVNYVENTQPEGWGVDLTVRRLLNLQAHLRNRQTQRHLSVSQHRKSEWQKQDSPWGLLLVGLA